MKTKILILLFFISNLSFAQFDDILKKTIGNPDAWVPGKSVTTTINDALPIVNYLDFLKGTEPDSVFDLSNMKPGYYRGNIQSYCVKAGTYGPTKGSGYLIAPLLGKNADMIESILDKSVSHPEIDQKDIQLLLWAIEAGTKFDDIPNALKLRVKPLLTASDIVRLNVDINDAVNLLPSELVELGSFYKNVRDRIKDPKTSYEDIERLAVTQAGIGIDLREETTTGKWAYIGDNYYMRTFPIDYTKTTLEIIALPSVTVSRDGKQRLTSITGNGYKTEIEYDDAPGRDILSISGKTDLPIWRFKKLTFTSDEGEQVVIENRGWALRNGGKPIEGSIGKGVTLETDNELNTPSYDSYMVRVNFSAAANKNMKESIDATTKKNKGQGGREGIEEISEFNPDRDVHDGMRAATDPSDFKEKRKWFNNNLMNTLNAWKCAIASLGGGGCNDNPKPPIRRYPSVPANTSFQRLVNSGRGAR